MNTLSSDECCDCGSSQLVTIPDSGEIVCERCGIVISDKTEEKGPEWRFVTSTGVEKETTEIEQECLFR